MNGCEFLDDNNFYKIHSYKELHNFKTDKRLESKYKFLAEHLNTRHTESVGKAEFTLLNISSPNDYCYIQKINKKTIFFYWYWSK